MQEAHKNDAVRKSEFWFRRQVQTTDSPKCCSSICGESVTDSTARNECFKKMSIDTIINGKVSTVLSIDCLWLNISTEMKQIVPHSSGISL